MDQLISIPLSLRTFLFIAISVGAANGANTCDQLVTLQLPNTKIVLAQSTPATTLLGPLDIPIKIENSFCRISGISRPSDDSEIYFEVWMPESKWNGRFRGVGNGGFAGSINYGGMAAAVRDGFATASTDTGHKADTVDAGWALGHPEKVTDFGYRAIHLMTENAKAVIESFYGEAAAHSYFESCSNGGRQALMEAQRFPADYDGILAGAPANYWTHLTVPAFFNVLVPQLDDPAAYIPASKIPAISAAVLKACDAGDGLTDGIVSNPPKCHFDPSVLLCRGPETDSCLTGREAAELKRIYAGAAGFPGLSPGGEDGPGGWKTWVTGDAPARSLGAAFGFGFLRNMLFQDSRWNYRDTTLRRALEKADAELAPKLNATDGNLQPFAQHGGKLIIYHGWSDAAIPALNSVNYYNSAVKVSSASAEGFLRLYLAPGTQHCGGGPGPSLFGQWGVLAPIDPQHNMSTALVNWVEQGAAPQEIIATKFRDDNPAEGVGMTRPLCPYPQIASYKGQGDPNDSGSFVCQAQ